MTTWHPIPTYGDRYEISDDGQRVRGHYYGSKAGARRRDEPLELKPSIDRWGGVRFSLTQNGVTRLRSAKHLLRLAEAGQGAEHWFSLPEPYAGLYEMSTHGEVRSLMRRKGTPYKTPHVLKPFSTRGVTTTRIYRLSADGVERALSHRTLAKMFAVGHPIRTYCLGDKDKGERVEVDLSKRYRPGLQPANPIDPGFTKRAKEEAASLPARVISEIRKKWARRNLRRYHTVTIEILADTHLLTMAQVRAIVEGVEEVRA